MAHEVVLAETWVETLEQLEPEDAERLNYRGEESQPPTDRDSGLTAAGDDLATDWASIDEPQDSHSEGETRPTTSGPYAS